MYYIGVDIGGTKTSVSVGNKQGRILKKEKFPTSTPEQTIPKIVSYIATFSKKYDIHALGLSAPGPVSTKKKKLIAPPNLPNWENFPIVEELKKKIDHPIFFNNDANAAVLAEYYFGEFAGTSDMIYLTVSTGMGAGIICSNKLLQGVTDTAGEVGHITLETFSDKKSGGIIGSFESFCGGYAMAKYTQATIQKLKIDTSLASKRNLTMEDIVDAVRKKDPYAIEVFEQYIFRLAHGISTLIMILNPKVITLGTIAQHAGDLLMKPLKKKLKTFCWDAPLKAVKIKPSILKNIGDVGAIALAIHSTED